MAKKKFLLGAAIGAAVAGGLALLFAPKSGKELRADIARNAKAMSKDLDTQIARAKRQAKQLEGEAQQKRLETIKKAEDLKSLLESKGEELGKSGKKVSKVAMREADKLIQDGKIVLRQMDEQGEVALKQAKKYAKKAGKSAGRVAKSARKEFTTSKNKSK